MTAEGGEPPELFPPFKRTKSAVWEYFSYRKKTDGRGLGEEGPNVQNMLVDSDSTSNMIVSKSPKTVEIQF